MSSLILLVVQSLSPVWLFATPWIAACQASLSITNSQNLLTLMSIELVMPSNNLILCCPLLLLPSILEDNKILISYSEFKLFHYIKLCIVTVLYVFKSWEDMLLLLLSHFSRVWLCDPIDGSPLGSSVPGILQARTLEWVAISLRRHERETKRS